MKLLLDTHLALWAITDDPRLPRRARSMIAAAENLPYVSVVSLWEIALKRARRPKRIRFDAADALGHFVAAGYEILPLQPSHVLALEGLAGHHDDPFDRMLVAQALSEPLRLVSHDGALAPYGDHVLVV